MGKLSETMLKMDEIIKGTNLKMKDS